jgi:hypothetical protein
MILPTELRQRLKWERSICVNEACDRCGALLGAVRFTRAGESSVWCSRKCRDGANAHAPGTCRACGASLAGLRRGTKFCSAVCRVRENRKSQTIQNSRNEPLKTQGLKSRVEVLPAVAHSGLDGAPETLRFEFREREGMKGRKCIEESRATELRQRLIEWQCLPKSARPSLRALARELNTTHQLLSFYLTGLVRWRFAKDLEQFRANAKARGIAVTPRHEQRYLEWLRNIKNKQEREHKKYMPLLCKAVGVPYTGDRDVDEAAYRKAGQRLLEDLLRRLPKDWK